MFVTGKRIESNPDTLFCVSSLFWSLFFFCFLNEWEWNIPNLMTLPPVCHTVACCHNRWENTFWKTQTSRLIKKRALLLLKTESWPEPHNISLSPKSLSSSDRRCRKHRRNIIFMLLLCPQFRINTVVFLLLQSLPQKWTLEQVLGTHLSVWPKPTQVQILHGAGKVAWMTVSA